MNVAAELTQIISAYQPGATIQSTWGFDGGLSAHMTGVEIVTSQGEVKRLILRQHREAKLANDPSAAKREYDLLRALADAGLPVSRPLKYDDSGDIVPTPYVLLGFIDGAALYAPTDRDDYLRQAATTLARIHKTPPDAVTGLGPAHHTDSGNGPCLLHGDYWPGNWLWRDGDLVAVIDWEDAAIGDPLRDVAITRRDMAIIFGIDAVNTFTQHYLENNPLNLKGLPALDLKAAEEAAPHLAEWAAGYPALGRPDITEATMQAGLEAFIVQANERLQIP